MSAKTLLSVSTPEGSFVASWWLWLRFSVRRVVSNPLRVGIVLLSVALATTLASAVFQVAIASINSFEQSIAGGERPYHMLITPVGGRLHRDTLAACLRSLTPYADIVAIRREAAVLTQDERTAPVRVAGVGGLGSDVSEFSAGERFVTHELAESMKLKASQGVTITIDGHKSHVAVTRETESVVLAGYADIVLALSDLPPSPALDSVALRFRTADLEQAQRAASEWIASCNQGVPPLRIEPVRAPIERGEQLLAAYRFNIMIMAAIALLVCVMLISQATQITLRSIVHELATLRTLGVSAVTCVVMVVGEAALVSFFGSTLGVTLGAPLVVWVAGFLTSTASEIYNLSLESASAVSVIGRSALVVVGMTCVGAIASLLGARDVVVLAPYRGTRREQKMVRPLRQKAVVGVASAATVVLCIAVALLVRKSSAELAYIVVGLMIAWSAACIPLVLYLAPFGVHVFRRYVPARLAASTLRVSGRSFVLSGTAVSVAISLLVGLALMVSSFRDTLHRWSAIRLAGDLFISSTLAGTGNEARISSEILQTVRALPGVKRVIPYYEAAARVGSKEVMLGGVDLKAQCDRRVYSFVVGECNTPEGSWRGQALASESAARKLGVRVADQISVSGERYTIRGIIQEFGTEQPLIVIDASNFEARYPGHNPDTLTIDLIDTTRLDTTLTALRALVPVTVTVRSQRELLTLVETLFNRTFRVTESVRWIVFAMALLGLVSTAAQHMWERRRELRVVEVLGVSHQELVGALTAEAVVVTGSSVVAGILGGIGIGWCLTEYINPLVFGWTLLFRVSLWPSVEALLFVVSVGMVTPLVAHRIIMRIVTSVSLADE